MSSKRAAEDNTTIVQPTKAPKIKNKLLDPLVHDALSCVFDQKVLHWSDAMTLGATCKEMREVWKEKQDAYLSPLLKVLESFVGKPSGNVDEDFDKVLRLELLDEGYADFSVMKKCEKMTLFVQTIVANMQNHNFCLDDPSNPDKNKECNPRGWSMGYGMDAENNFLQNFVRRSTLVINIATFAFALSAMEEGGDMYFNDVFLGKEGAYLGGGSGYGHVILHKVSRMLPFRNKDLVKHMRALYPHQDKLKILGPVLTNKVVLAAPFFRWVPPNDDNDNGTCFKDLPSPLEELNEDIIRSVGMEQFLSPRDGISY